MCIPSKSPADWSRQAFGTGISTLKLVGEAHHIVSSGQMIGALRRSKSAHLSDVEAKKRIWRNVFGVPKSQLGLYHELVSAIQIPVTFHLDALLVDNRKDASQSVLRRLQGNMPDLVSFNPSLIDQEPWEKVSNVKVTEDKKLAEVSLLPLVFLFLTHMTTHTFVSDGLLSDQDHQETGPLLLAFVQSYSLLMSGIPRWLPHPTLPGAHITRRKLLGHLDALLDITEDAELQNDLLTARSRMLDDHRTPQPIRTIELLRLLHGLNAPHILAFWTLLHVISEPNLLEQIRHEAKQVVSIEQEKPVMGFTVPPRLKIDSTVLLGKKTKLLQKCWLESARVYSRGQESWTTTESFELDGGEGGVFKTADKWKIEKGEWIDAPFWHGNSDPAAWEEVSEWDPTRHGGPGDEDIFASSKVLQDRKSALSHRESVVLIRITAALFGMNEATKPARLFGLAFIASAVLLYDFELDGDKSIPKPKFAAGVALPEEDVRVRIRKRVTA